MSETTETVVTVIDACGRARVPVLLEGPPGCGKSSLVRSLAESENAAYERVIASIREPADFAGLPVITPEGVSFEPPRWAKRLAAAEHGYAFFDEINTATEAVQGAMLAVVLDGEVGDLQLPETIRMIAAQNPADESAGGSDLARPLANRFCKIIFDPTVEDWIDGMTNGWKTLPVSRAVARTVERNAEIVSAVASFVKHRPTLLKPDPKSAVEAGGSWPSGRTWDMLSKVLSHLRSNDTAAVHMAVFGLVGEAAGLEFVKWLEEMDLPSADAVIADPSIVDWANERQDRIWAVLNAVTTLATQRGGVEQWRAAWKPLGAAFDAKRADFAAAAATSLCRNRPKSASIPAVMRKFGPMLVAAGLLDETELAPKPKGEVA
jgi:hypothetical protein